MNCSGLILYVNIWKILLWYYIEVWYLIDYRCIYIDINLVLFLFFWFGVRKMRIELDLCWYVYVFVINWMLGFNVML